MESLRLSKWLQLLAVFVLVHDGFQLNDIVDVNTVHNPLDIGAVYNCTVPTNLTFCDINYPVPEAVNTLAKVTETLIENEYNTFIDLAVTDDCLDEVRELLCVQYFPRCYLEGEVVNVEVTGECLPSCEKAEPVKPCDFIFKVNSSLGDCKLVSHYAAETEYTFTVCDISEKRYVTEWMFQYLLETDQELENSKAFLESSPSACLPDYFDFKCQEVGRCWNQGTRIEMSKNNAECTRLNSLQCFDSSQLSIVVSPNLVCDGYPDVEPLATEPTMIVALNSTTDTSPTVSATNITAVDPPSSAPAVRSCLPMLSTSLILCIVIRRLFI